MPVKTTVHVFGLSELGAAMRGLSADIALRVAGQATGAGAQVIKKKAIRNVVSSPSVDTGSLRDAIIVKKIPKGQAQYTAEHIVTIRGKSGRTKKTKTKQAIAAHARFVEYGTVHMKAEPFLRPAYDTEKEHAVEAIASKLRKRIEAVREK